MPIAIDPDQTVDIYLKIDVPKPKETRPTFVCRFLTCRQVLRVEKLLKEASETPDQVQTNALLNESIGISVVGWKNLSDAAGGAIPFAIDLLDDILTPTEKWELAYSAMREVMIGEAERKKSASEPALSSASSVAPVPAAVA